MGMPGTISPANDQQPVKKQTLQRFYQCGAQFRRLKEYPSETGRIRRYNPRFTVVTRLRESRVAWRWTTRDQSRRSRH